MKYITRLLLVLALCASLLTGVSATDDKTVRVEDAGVTLDLSALGDCYVFTRTDMASGALDAVGMTRSDMDSYMTRNNLYLVVLPDVPAGTSWEFRLMTMDFTGAGRLFQEESDEILDLFKESMLEGMSEQDRQTTRLDARWQRTDAHLFAAVELNGYQGFYTLMGATGVGDTCYYFYYAFYQPYTEADRRTLESVLDTVVIDGVDSVFRPPAADSGPLEYYDPEGRLGFTLPEGWSMERASGDGLDGVTFRHGGGLMEGIFYLGADIEKLTEVGGLDASIYDGLDREDMNNGAFTMEDVKKLADELMDDAKVSTVTYAGRTFFCLEGRVKQYAGMDAVMLMRLEEGYYYYFLCLGKRDSTSFAVLEQALEDAVWENPAPKNDKPTERDVPIFLILFFPGLVVVISLVVWLMVRSAGKRREAQLYRSPRCCANCGSPIPAGEPYCTRCVRRE